MRKDFYRGRMMITILVLIAIMGIGYAFLGANLQINGVSEIPASSWIVRFKENSINVTNGSVSIDTNNNEQAATIDDDSNVSYKVRLSLPGDFYEFTVVVENKGSIDAMIDTVSSKLGNTEITTGTLPSYLNYSVTYSDGVAIAPKHLLAANTEETYKVRIEFKKDVTITQLPTEATTLNLNFQVNYVQKDDTAISIPRINLGDYISLTPDASTYTIPATLTGYDSDQTINPSELTLWRVIKKNDDGSVDAVSEYTSSTAVYFKGTTGYANYVGGLQTIAASYAKAGYTISTRMMGYDGQTLTIADTSAFDGSTNIAPSTTSTSTQASGDGQEYSGGVLGDTLYLNDYRLVRNVYGNVKANEVGTTTARAYWLASRKYNYDAGNYFYYNGRCVGSNGDLLIDYIRLFFNGWYDSALRHPVRPILTLKSEVSITSGSGTSAEPYTLS